MSKGKAGDVSIKIWLADDKISSVASRLLLNDISFFSTVDEDGLTTNTTLFSGRSVVKHLPHRRLSLFF